MALIHMSSFNSYWFSFIRLKSKMDDLKVINMYKAERRFITELSKILVMNK